MRILVTGASGFIGSHIVQALLRTGHEVTACVRTTRAVKQRWSKINVIQADFSRDHNEQIWLARLKNIDVVINAVGIIREQGKQTFEALHTRAPCALFRASQKAGINRVIQISALGADESAFSQYHLSKRAADRCLMSLNLDWVILKPSIVYGPGAKSMAFFKALAALPIIPLVDAGDQPVQPIHIDDMIRAILQTLQPETPSQLIIEIVGPRPITMKKIFIQLRDWLGMGKARFISLPYKIALRAGRWGGFSGNTPMTAEVIQMLHKGNTGDVTPFIKQFGFSPASFEDTLKHTPAQQSDKWHAGLFFLRPCLRFSIAFLWIFTGIISAFVFPLEHSYAMLAKAGITKIWAPILLYAASATDIALGIATLLAYRLHLVGLIQISVILLYTFIITFSQPDQWLHPFGPVSKNLPLIVATLIMLVLERKR